jgi:RNA polymerase sigma-70 factor (ECF subfamily)
MIPDGNPRCPVSDNVPDWPAFIPRHGPVALLYARQLTASYADAQDALQDGFLRFWAHRDVAIDHPALLFACIRSAALDLRRRDSRRRARELDHPHPSLAGPDASTELREQIQHALSELPEPQREVVVLKIWSGLTFAQIAGALAESPNTVAARFRYAMQKLEHLLSPEFKHER